MRKLIVLFAALSCTALQASGPRTGAKVSASAASGKARSYSPFTDSTLMSGCIGAFVPAFVSYNAQEITLGNTLATADTNSCGLVADQSQCGLILASPGAGSCPILSSGGPAYSTALTFSNANRYLTIHGSNYWSKQYHTTQVGTIAVQVKMLADGSVGRIFASCDNSTANAGTILMSQADNTLLLRQYKALSGSTVINAASSFTVTTTDGPTWLVIRLTGNGTTSGRFSKITSAQAIITETFATNGATTTTAPSQYEWTFGRTQSDSANHFRGSLGQAWFFNRALTDAECQLLASYKPQRTLASNFRKVTTTAGTLADYSHVAGLYQFDTTSTLFTDTAKTTNVTTSGDGVSVARHYFAQSLGLDLQRDAVVVTFASKPAYVTSVYGSQHAVRWTNDDSGTGVQSLALEHSLECLPNWTIFAVGRNFDTTNGSHLVRAGSRYLVHTGSSYVGALTSPYFVLHTGGNDPSFTLTDTALKVICVRKSGTTWRGYVNGVLVSTTSGAGQGFITSAFGSNAISDANWNCNGDVTHCAVINDDVGDAFAVSESKRLMTRYGL